MHACKNTAYCEVGVWWPATHLGHDQLIIVIIVMLGSMMCCQLHVDCVVWAAALCGHCLLLDIQDFAKMVL